MPDVKEPDKSVRDDERLHGWKKWLAYQYIGVCLFDFIIAPSFVGGLQRDVYSMLGQIKTMPEAVQLALVTHEPWTSLTVQQGALYHVAMGAILTGVAVFGPRGKQP